MLGVFPKRERESVRGADKHLILITALYVASLGGTMSKPRVDAQCSASQFRLGTSNVPIDSTVAHSVVNIWSFRAAGQKTPLAWLYKNLSQAYYFQLSPAGSSSLAFLRSDRPNLFDRQALGKRVTFGNFPIVAMRPTELLAIENVLITQGVQRTGCFSGDLRFTK